MNLYIQNLTFLSQIDNSKKIIEHDNLLKYDDRYFGYLRTDYNKQIIEVIETSFFNIINISKINKTNKYDNLILESLNKFIQYCHENEFSEDEINRIHELLKFIKDNITDNINNYKVKTFLEKALNYINSIYNYIRSFFY
jgi:uncharacterized protein YpuA (DUF1002 family)